MFLYDRAADEQPDAHAATLARIEGFEQRVHGPWREADAGVTHRETYTRAVLTLGFDQQLSRPIVHIDHRVRSVAEQIQDDLLQLNPIARDEREIIGEFRPHD